MKRMKSKYSGFCRTCDGPIRAGDSIVWGKSAGAHHPECWDDNHSPDPERRAAGGEYQQGYAEGRRYGAERDLYGEEYAERLQLEREMNPRNWDW